MREHTERVDRADREDRPQDRASQPGDDRERGEVAEEHVLDHVEAQELLLTERVDRRDERDEDESEPRPERPHAPARNLGPARAEVADAPPVQERDDEEGDDLERLKGPARQERWTNVHVTSLESRGFGAALPLPPRYEQGARDRGAVSRPARVQPPRPLRTHRRGAGDVRGGRAMGGARPDGLPAAAERAPTGGGQRRRPAGPLGDPARRPSRSRARRG